MNDNKVNKDDELGTSNLDEKIELMLEKVMLDEKEDGYNSNEGTNVQTDNTNRGNIRKNTKSLTFQSKNPYLIKNELLKIEKDFAKLRNESPINKIFSDDEGEDPNEDSGDDIFNENKRIFDFHDNFDSKKFTRVTNKTGNNQINTNNSEIPQFCMPNTFKNRNPLCKPIENNNNVIRKDRKFKTVTLSNKPNINFFPNQFNQNIPHFTNFPQNNNYSNPYNTQMFPPYNNGNIMINNNNRFPNQ